MTRDEILQLKPIFEFEGVDMVDWFCIKEGDNTFSITSGLKHADGETKSPYYYNDYVIGENASEIALNNFNKWWYSFKPKTNYKPEHIQDFIALHKRYKTIELDEILHEFNKNQNILEKREAKSNILSTLTGFGSSCACTLCSSSNHKCWGCIHSIKNNDMGCLEDITYRLIWGAETPIELLTAYRKRAEYFESLAKEQHINIE